MSDNKEALESFIKYCKKHPSERFWQALRNWSGMHFIAAVDKPLEDGSLIYEDTFYWSDRRSER